MNKVMACMLALCILSAHLYAQDDEALGGFGFDDDTGAAQDSGIAVKIPAVTIGGEVKAVLKAYTGDIAAGDMEEVSLGDVFSGKLNFSASSNRADAVLNFDIVPPAAGESPLKIDEAYIRAYFGRLDIEGGIRRLTWGKADSAGPLDVINPLDYSDLTRLGGDAADMKIARPLLHASLALGAFSKIEGVFVPAFEGMRFAGSGRWMPDELREKPATIKQDAMKYSAKDIVALFPAVMQSAIAGQIATRMSSMNLNSKYPNTDNLAFFQGGVRFTTSFASQDMGLQYYYGRLPRPAVSIKGLKAVNEALKKGDIPTATGLLDAITPLIAYNPYHQIGLDWASVITGFNLRAEAAVNLTSDLDGSDGAIYNPAVLWSLGFDRDLFFGVNLNLQCNESIRLFHDKVSDNAALDTEAGKSLTSTRVTAKIAKTFFRDELECALKAVYGVEDADCLVMPSLSWTKNDVTLESSGGIFAGSDDGELGQYKGNNFVTVSVKYVF